MNQDKIKEVILHPMDSTCKKEMTDDQLSEETKKTESMQKLRLWRAMDIELTENLSSIIKCMEKRTNQLKTVKNELIDEYQKFEQMDVFQAYVWLNIIKEKRFENKNIFIMEFVELYEKNTNSLNELKYDLQEIQSNEQENVQQNNDLQENKSNEQGSEEKKEQDKHVEQKTISKTIFTFTKELMETSIEYYALDQLWINDDIIKMRTENKKEESEFWKILISKIDELIIKHSTNRGITIKGTKDLELEMRKIIEYYKKILDVDITQSENKEKIWKEKLECRQKENKDRLPTLFYEMSSEELNIKLHICDQENEECFKLIDTIDTLSNCTMM